MRAIWNNHPPSLPGQPRRIARLAARSAAEPGTCQLITTARRPEDDGNKAGASPAHRLIPSTPRRPGIAWSPTAPLTSRPETCTPATAPAATVSSCRRPKSTFNPGIVMGESPCCALEFTPTALESRRTPSPGGGHHVVEQIGGSDGRARRGQHADLKRQQQHGSRNPRRRRQRRDEECRSQRDDLGTARPKHPSTLASTQPGQQPKTRLNAPGK